ARRRRRRRRRLALLTGDGLRLVGIVPAPLVGRFPFLGFRRRGRGGRRLCSPRRGRRAGPHEERGRVGEHHGGIGGFALGAFARCGHRGAVDQRARRAGLGRLRPVLDDDRLLRGRLGWGRRRPGLGGRGSGGRGGGGVLARRHRFELVDAHGDRGRGA